MISPFFVIASSFNNNLHHMLVQRSFENNPISSKTYNLRNQHLITCQINILFDTFLLYFLMTLFVLNLAFKCFSRHFFIFSNLWGDAVVVLPVTTDCAQIPNIQISIKKEKRGLGPKRTTLKLSLSRTSCMTGTTLV